MFRGLAYKPEGQRDGCTVGASMRSENPSAEVSLRAKAGWEGTEVKSNINITTAG